MGILKLYRKMGCLFILVMLVVGLAYAFENGDQVSGLFDQGKDALVPDEITIELPDEAKPIIDQFKNDMAVRKGVDASEVEVIEAEVTVWTEGAIIKKGYRVVLEIGGTRAEYRLNKDGSYQLQAQF